MMKKWISIVLGAVMLGTMAACSNPSNTEPDSQESSVPSSSSSQELSQPETSESTDSAILLRVSVERSVNVILSISIVADF